LLCPQKLKNVGKGALEAVDHGRLTVIMLLP